MSGLVVYLVDRIPKKTKSRITIGRKRSHSLLELETPGFYTMLVSVIEDKSTTPQSGGSNLPLLLLS
ncbi:hypothetical protein A7K93_02465 [Candidatus Methylacidiphilum fumarolicum]|nr:hypothetical protein A7K93_02465 [Candidatus Methylacidiphilum fumarolicum]